MTDGDRAERDGSVELRSLSNYIRGLPSTERLPRVSRVRSYLAPLDPHPALRATFPRKGGKGFPSRKTQFSTDSVISGRRLSMPGALKLEAST